MSTPQATGAVVAERDPYYGHTYLLPTRYTYDLMATEEARWNVLATMGITREHGDSPLVAWRNAVQDYSGIERKPSLDLCFSTTQVRQFVMYLA